MLLQRHDQSATRRQEVDRGGYREIRIEQHRAATRRERCDQQPLDGGHVGIFDLLFCNPFRLCDRFKQRRPLVERDHAEMAVRVGKARQAAILSNRSH